MAQVHLTFDNGPDPEVTPRVLEVLARRNLRATFFVLGKHLATSRGMEMARLIRDAGHRLGNHSYSHEIPLGQDPRVGTVERELARTEALLDEVYDGPRLFRPFGGGGILGPHLFSPASVAWLAARGYTCVLWNSVPGDWLEPDGWVESALEDAEQLEHMVLVLHDILPDAMAHLGAFLDALVDRGHTFTDAIPLECLPMVDGVAGPELARFTQQPGAAPP